MSLKVLVLLQKHPVMRPTYWAKGRPPGCGGQVMFRHTHQHTVIFFIARKPQSKAGRRKATLFDIPKAFPVSPRALVNYLANYQRVFRWDEILLLQQFTNL